MIGFTCSSFDLLHAGHVIMLKECSENCDELIVGLNVNPCKNGRYPVQSVMERYTQLQALEYVDEIIPYNSENELEDLLELYPIDIRFIGLDYLGSSFTGQEICENKNIEIFYNARYHSFSSLELKERVCDNINQDILDGETVKDNNTYTIIDNTELDNLTVSTTTLKPDMETGGHKHHNIDEVYTFLSGIGLIIIDEVEHWVERGKTVIIPAGAYHKVYNSSKDEDLVFICVFNNRRNH